MNDGARLSKWQAAAEFLTQAIKDELLSILQTFDIPSE
jgi:hypothetical protein